MRLSARYLVLLLCLWKDLLALFSDPIRQANHIEAPLVVVEELLYY